MHFPEAETAPKPTEPDLLLQSREGPRDFLFLFNVANEVSASLTLLSWFSQEILIDRCFLISITGRKSKQSLKGNM